MDVVCSPDQICLSATNEENVNFGRQSANYQPSLWADYFISHPLLPANQKTSMELRAEELRELVKKMFAENADLLEKMKLIDLLERLALDYHFKEEILEALKCIHGSHVDYDDLHAVALHFRLLRQQGYNYSSDVFKKFLDSKGNFKEILSNDAKGLFSLYEASFLGVREDHILDEAMAFARVHLESMMPHMESGLAAQTKLALATPLFRGIRRLNARHYISIYQEKAHNPVLLELAKIDFHLLQFLHQSELASVSRWWKELGLTKKLSFARDRLVETYFFTWAIFYEPQHSEARKLMTKLIAFIGVMDDMFDVFGTIEELQKFTHVIRRWELHDVDELPEYMQIFLQSYISFIQEVEEAMPRECRHTYMDFLAKEMKGLTVVYLEEVKWASKGYTPSLEEYLRVSGISCIYPLIICASVIFSGEKVTKEGLNWLSSLPKMVEACSLIARIRDDLVSSEHEKKRKHVATSVECYINEYGVSEEEARAALQRMVDDAWKDINQELLADHPQPLEFSHLVRIVDFARLVEVAYKNEDGFTHPRGEMKDRIKLLFVDPIPPAATNEYVI